MRGLRAIADNLAEERYVKPGHNKTVAELALVLTVLLTRMACDSGQIHDAVDRVNDVAYQLLV